jgi:hypothetical protein
VPGTTYRYQLMVTTSAGTTSYAPAKTLQTPRVTPRRVRAQISDTGGQHAAHGYRLSGRIMLGRGLSDQVGCKTQGAVTVTVTRGTKVIARHRVDVSTGCTYTTTFSFPDAERRGSGRVGVHVTFAGNRQLRARSARTLHVA